MEKEVFRPHQVVQEPERRVDHVTGTRGDLGAATKTGEIVADVAVVLLDREGQILASEELLRRNQPVKAFPVVGQEDTALDADLVEKSAAGRIITPTQLPGQGSPCHRVVGPPEPNLARDCRWRCRMPSSPGRLAEHGLVKANGSGSTPRRWRPTPPCGRSCGAPMARPIGRCWSAWRRRAGSRRRGRGPGRADGRQDPMWAVSGGLTRSKMAASNQGAEDRKMSAGRETVAAVPGAAPAGVLADEVRKGGRDVPPPPPARAPGSPPPPPARAPQGLLALPGKARAAPP